MKRQLSPQDYVQPADVDAMLEWARARRTKTGRAHRNARRDFLLLALIGKVGLRTCEVLQLTAADVHLDDAEGASVWVEGRHRTVRLGSPFVTRGLTASLAAYVARVAPNGQGKLFDLTDRRLRYLVAFYGRRAGGPALELQPASPLRLRHSLGVRTVRAGVDLVHVARQLGQKSLEAAGIYVSDLVEPAI